MIVEFGNTAPVHTENTPAVTSIPLDDDAYGYTPHESADVLAGKLARHLATAQGGITRVGDISDGTGGHEAFLAVYSAVRAESNATPAWVWSDNDDFAVLLGAFYECPVGRPDDLEATHFTRHGEPGVGPAPEVAE